MSVSMLPVSTSARFRAQTSAAPLKLQIEQRRARQILEFPRSDERGPIEADPWPPDRTLADLVSALRRARPH